MGFMDDVVAVDQPIQQKPLMRKTNENTVQPANSGFMSDAKTMTVPVLTPQQKQRVDEAKAFEKSSVGQILLGLENGMGTLKQFFGFKNDVVPVSQMMEEKYLKKNQQISEGKGFIQRTVEDVTQAAPQVLADAGQDAIAAGTLMLGGAGGQTGKGLLRLGKYAATQATIAGTGQFAKEKLQGKSNDEAAQDAEATAALSAFLVPGSEGVQKLLGAFSKAVVKSGSSVRGFAVDQAIKDPKILYEPQPMVIEVGNKMKQQLFDYAKIIKTERADLLQKLNIPEGVAVDMAPVKEQIVKMGIPRAELKRALANGAKSELVDVGENAIDRFVNGGALSFQEAEKINSLMFDLSTTGRTEALGSGGIGRLKSVKKALLKSMDDVAPGIKDANRQYAQAIEKYDFINSNITDSHGNPNEGALNTIGQQRAGIKRAKTQLINDIEEVQNYVNGYNAKTSQAPPQDYLSQLTKSLAAEEFDKQGMMNLMSYLRMSGGAGIGAMTYGPLGAIGGMMTMAAMENPQMTKGLIGAGTAFTKPAIQSIRVGLQTPQNANNAGDFVRQKLMERQNKGGQ